MATIKMTGIEEYSKALSEMKLKMRDEVLQRAVYDGSAVVANALKAELENLPTDGGTGSQDKLLNGINRVQKDALIASMGISRIKVFGGAVHASVGFDGYNPIKTKRWPKGQPNSVVARSLERGTTFLRANPFMKRSLQRCKKKTIDVMASTVDAEIKKIMDKK